jgi:N-acetylmuramoyl-L-alanine amidase
MNIGTRILSRTAIAGALACLLLPAGIHARSVKQKKEAARTQFETAERMREALYGRTETQRTRREYQKVIDAYRKVYYTAPNSVKADASVLAVAELLDDEGRVLQDPKSFKDAIGQLTFLRKEYPGSKYRAEALFTIAQIYRDDLDDSNQAKATFADFLKRYPGNTHAPEAKKAIAEIDTPPNPFSAKTTKKESAPRTRSEKASTDSARSSGSAKPGDSARTSDSEKASAKADDETAPAPPEHQQNVSVAVTDPHHLARLTGIRHWSTPDYTRVAIDLEQEVKYQAGRVPHPDRIFFDLYGTKLASDLVGKTFEVDAGFLHKVRVAQYKVNMARVVLDVDDVAEYSAFLLPNPYRLIIDIHGKLPARQVAAKQEPRLLQADITQPEVKQPAKDPDTGSDVTVTNLKKPETRRTETAAALPPAETPRSFSDKTALSRTTPVKTQDKDKPVLEKTAKTTEIAKADVPKTDTHQADIAKADIAKITANDTGVEDPGKVTGKPTTGPTFESIAPKESSRSKKKTPEPSPRLPVSTSHVAAPTASGERSLIRALGLKIGKIVVDAGHGGHDTGTIGPNGLEEKDLVLEVALKLGKLLEDRLGAEVVYTRDDDTFIPLETRTAIANKEQADLFISIHANSSSDSTARGVETYYLNFTSRADALEVAARENAVSEKSIHELQDLVKKIALKEKIGESREFAEDVQKSLYTGLNAKSPGLRNRGVKKAPFVVLIGANMPSILAEISFVSNPADEKRLKTSDYRQRIAESLFKGVSKYVGSLSGVKVASKNGSSGGGTVVGTASVALK